jgi:hypothetical protein
MLFREIITFHCENYTKHKYTVWAECKVGDVKQPMHVVTTVLWIADALMPSGHYMYHQFNIQQFYVLPTQRIYVFCVDLRTTAIISLYSSNWLVFITETESAYCAVRTEYM